MTEAPVLSVILPVHNEGPNIERVLSQLARYAPAEREVLVVHDMDDDDTLPVVRRLQPRMPEVRLVRNALGHGVLNAIKTGISASSGRWVLVTMADGSDDLSDLPPMIEAARSGVVIVAASRYMRGGAQLGGPRIKGALSRIAGLTLHHVASLPIHDPTSNFKLYDRGFLSSVRIESEGGFEMALELCVKAHRRGLRSAEVPTVWRDRVAGKSGFALAAWLPRYLRWFWYGIRTGIGRPSG